MTGGDGGTSPASHNLPQYGELDPPPAYSVLFPTQKPSDGSDDLPVVTITTTEPAAQTNSPSISNGSNSNSHITSIAEQSPMAERGGGGGGETLVVAPDTSPTLPVSPSAPSLVV